MNEEFKASMQTAWTVTDEGLIYKGMMYRWDDVRDLSVFSNPKTALTNGVFTVSLRGKTKNLAFSYKDKERANAAFDFMQAKILEADLVRRGIDPETADLALTVDDRKESLVIYNNLDDVLSVAVEVIPPTEVLLVALKGAFKEYLFCTDKMVYIYKRGFMTGHTFGKGAFKMPYENVTNAEVDYHLASGYFELSSGGLQNKKLSYWDQKDNSASKAPNAISLTGGDLRKQFEQASQFIIERSNDAKNPKQVVVQAATPAASDAEEILKFKELLDMGVISQEEYDAKKKQLLGL